MFYLKVAKKTPIYIGCFFCNFCYNKKRIRSNIKKVIKKITSYKTMVFFLHLAKVKNKSNKNSKSCKKNIIYTIGVFFATFATIDKSIHKYKNVNKLLYFK